MLGLRKLACHNLSVGIYCECKYLRDSLKDTNKRAKYKSFFIPPIFAQMEAKHYLRAP